MNRDELIIQTIKALLKSQNDILYMYGTAPNKEREAQINELLNCIKQFEPQPPRTQGDKIRAMSNEELIIILSNTFTKCPYCMYRGKPCKIGDMCNQGILEFLNSEVKND